MNFTRPLDLSLKGVSHGETSTKCSPVWCDSLLNVKAIISNHDLLMDWNDDSVSEETGPWRWKYELSLPFFSLKRKVGEVRDEDGDTRPHQDDERPGPSDDPDFYVFNCNNDIKRISGPGPVSEDRFHPDECESSQLRVPVISSELRDPLEDLKCIWFGDSDSNSVIGENSCWRYTYTDPNATLGSLEMLLDNLKNCLRVVDPDLESVENCIEIYCAEEPEEVGLIGPVDQDLDMFSAYKEDKGHQQLIGDLSLSDEDDDVKEDRDINVEDSRGHGESLLAEDPAYPLKVVREKRYKDYSQVKAKADPTAVATMNDSSQEKQVENKSRSVPWRRCRRYSSIKSKEQIKSACVIFSTDTVMIENIQRQVTSDTGGSNENKYSSIILSNDEHKAIVEESISVSGADIPDLSDLINRDSGLGDAPDAGTEWLSDSECDTLLIDCD